MWRQTDEAGGAPTVRVACEAMRTRFEIVLVGDDPARLRAAGEAALAEIVEAEELLSPYRPDAALFAVNARAAVAPVPVSGRLFRLLDAAQDYCRRTEGAFDPTIGPLLRLWSGCADAGRIPTEAEIAATRPLVGMDRVVELDPAAQTVSFTLPGVSLHPGAIGKGYALDRATETLRDAGVTRALLHGGTSTVMALGGPWRIAIQHPTEPDTRLPAVELRDNSLSVSAVHGRTFYAGGRRFGHVLDPRMGRPVEATLLAASTAPTGTQTEALSTAALVLGPESRFSLTKHWPDAGFTFVPAE